MTVQNTGRIQRRMEGERVDKVRRCQSDDGGCTVNYGMGHPLRRHQGSTHIRGRLYGNTSFNKPDKVEQYKIVFASHFSWIN